ncbi:MAG: protein kinase domain-containing protein [Pseudomonadota bacterium]
MAEPGGESGAVEEGRLFETLCELDAEAQTKRLLELDKTQPALAARLRKLLAIDEAYGTHTARSVLATELPDPVGDVSDIGPFRLVRQIGRGGMGVVYLAERRSGFAQQVAIKILPRFAIDDAGRERFSQERRILAQLRHPNICSILDGGELPDGTPWLAMEYVPGEPLCAWCERNGIGLNERIGLFLQLCDAVQYAHRNLVIHRDLKDNNVLVEDSGRVRLLDFGIAKSLSPVADLGLTAAQDRFFSPLTAAPEQVRGERATIATDVYALGALLHQLLCGVLPFERPSRSPLELQRAILEDVPPRMSDTLQRAIEARRERDDGAAAPHAFASLAISPRALRGELDAIATHCLRKDPSERYAEIGDLIRDLHAWRSGHPISISQGDRLYRTRKFLRRHRLAVAFAATTTIGVLGALGVTLWQAAALREERDAAEAARRRSEADRDRARAVAAFMRDTFEEADPTRTTRSSLLARELIERGARRLEGLEGQHDIQADLALLLAESNAGMGLTRESEDILRAYAPAIQALAAADPAVRWRANNLRLANRMKLNLDAPELDRALDAAVDELQRSADSADTRTRAALLRSRLQARRSQFGDAARTLEDAVRLHGSALAPSKSLNLRVDLGHALLSANRPEDARRICEAIGRERLETFEPALQTRALRLIVRELKNREESGTALAEAIERWRRTTERLYGEDSLEAAKVYENMIDLTEDAREQDALIEKAYTIQRRKLPEVSIERAYAEYNMGYFQLELRNRPDLAEPHLAAAAEIGGRVAGRGHADVLTFELTWAETLNALGRHAICLERLASPRVDPEDASDAKRLSRLHLELAKAALALARPEQARTEAGAVHAVWQRLGAPIPADLAEAVGRIEARLPADPTASGSR